MDSERDQKLATAAGSRRLRRDEDGTAVLEMAIIVPLFFLLIFGIIGFGYLFMVREDMAHAAQEALRTALVTSPTQDSPDLQETVPVGVARKDLTSVFGAANAAGSSTSDGSYSCNSDESPQPAFGPLDICTNWDSSSGTHQYPSCSTLGYPNSNGQCMVIKITYHWSQAPIIPVLGPFNAFSPSTLTVSATGQVSGGGFTPQPATTTTTGPPSTSAPPSTTTTTLLPPLPTTTTTLLGL